MNGMFDQIPVEEPVYVKPKGVIGVVVSPRFAHPSSIRETIEEGIAALPDATWVMRDKRAANHAVNMAWDVLEEHGIEPLVTFSNSKYWTACTGREWADLEMMRLCSMLLVFNEGEGVVRDMFIKREYCVARRIIKDFTKPPKKKARKGRKPIGV